MDLVLLRNILTSIVGCVPYSFYPLFSIRMNVTKVLCFYHSYGLFPDR